METSSEKNLDIPTLEIKLRKKTCSVSSSSMDENAKKELDVTLCFCFF